MSGAAPGTASGLAAAIASVAERLPAAHVADWAQVLRTVTAEALVARPKEVEAQSNHLGHTASRMACGSGSRTHSRPGFRLPTTSC